MHFLMQRNVFSPLTMYGCILKEAMSILLTEFLFLEIHFLKKVPCKVYDGLNGKK